MKRLSTIIFLLMTLVTSCGGGMYTKDASEQDGPGADSSYTTPWGNVTITKDAFIFAGDYPSDIVIPDIDGMRDTAFVVSFSSPTGVLAIDLDSDPLTTSAKFKGLISPDGTGFPGNLYVMTENRAFLLTSSHVIDFDPQTGIVNTTIKLLGELELGRTMAISDPYDIDGDGANETSAETIDMNYPSDLAVAGNKLYITMSNLISPVSPAIAYPGVVRVFTITDDPPYLKESGRPIVTTDYNPVGVTPLPNGSIAVTNGGVTDIWDGAAHPLTKASIDIFDPETNEITGNIQMGKSALSFGKLAVTSDGSRAYVGSRSFGEVYSADLVNMTPINTHADPITVTGNAEGSDFFSSAVMSYDDWYLFAASFDNSSIYPIDVSGESPVVLPETFSEPFILGFPKGVTADNPTGTNTGIAKVAVRPGTPGVDYIGPDIFALTGNPGTLVTINTHGTGEGSTMQIKSLEIVLDNGKAPDPTKPIQLYLKITFADGTVIDDATDTFTNPYSGYPTKINWSSSNPNVASVKSGGIVMPKATGETVITATIGQRSASLAVTIQSASETVSPGPPEETPETPEEPDGHDNPDNPAYGHNPYADIPELVIFFDRDTINKIRCYNWMDSEHDPFADEVVQFDPGPDSGFGYDRFPDIVLGPPEGSGELAGGTDVLSLGKGGEIVLEMTDMIIVDGAGPDFTVFENPFYVGGDPDKPYSEPAVVSVSVDGKNFYRFNCACGDSDGPLYPGCAGTKAVYSNSDNGIDPTDPSVSGGDQFDLADVGLSSARFVKIVDCGKKGGLNSAGFDLDAVAIINGGCPYQ